MLTFFPILAPVLASMLFLLAAWSLRIITVTKVDQSVEAAPTAQKKAFRAFEAVIDRIGEVAQGGLGFLYPPSRRRLLIRTLDGAGHPEGLTPSLFIQRHSGFIVVAVLVAVPFLIQGNVLMAAIFGIGLAEWMWIWILLSAKDRRAEVESSLPDFLDVLGVTVSSGMSFRKSIQTVTQFYDGPLAEELSTVLYEMGVGIPRRQAFSSMRERVPSDSMDSFVTAILQAEELGVQLSDALTSIAVEVRRDHAAQVRRQAGRATAKVSLIATVLVVPGAVVLMFASLFLPILQSGAFNAFLG